MAVVRWLLVGLLLLFALALLSLWLLLSPHTSTVASSQPRELPARRQGSARPLLSPVLAAWLLRQLSAVEQGAAESGALWRPASADFTGEPSAEGVAGHAAVHFAGADSHRSGVSGAPLRQLPLCPWQPASAGPGGGAVVSAGDAAGNLTGSDGNRSGLTRAASRQLSLCFAPFRSHEDRPVAASLHRRVRAGNGTHGPTLDRADGGDGSSLLEPLIASVEQPARPAAPFASGRSRPSASEALLAAALRGGDAGIIQALLALIRQALMAIASPSQHTRGDMQSRQLPTSRHHLPEPSQVGLAHSY
jgi:hypothetical protein